MTSDDCKDIRTKIQDLVDETNNIRIQPPDKLMEGAAEGAQVGEVYANITLAVRHLEDARMRLGKAIQMFENRDSIYGR